MPGPDGKIAEFTNPNIYFFTKGHFSIIRVEGDQPRSTDPWISMTRDQVIDTYIKQFTASGGTYDMKGNTQWTWIERLLVIRRSVSSTY